MKEARLYITHFHKCAFCKHWYDPTNSHIRPKNQRTQLWEFDEKAKSYCDVKRVEKSADYGCMEFECKV